MYGIFKLIKEHFKDKVYMPEISSWGAAAISSLFSFCENSFSKGVSTVTKNAGFMRFPYTHIRRHSVRTNTCKASLWSFFFSPPASWPRYSRWGQAYSHPGFSMLAGSSLPLSGERAHKHHWLLGYWSFCGFTCILAHLLINPYANQNWLYNLSQAIQQECK